LIQRNAERRAGARIALIKQWEQTMTLDTIMVMIAVAAMLATLAVVLGWSDKETTGQAKKR
jgi:hypothetical protein